MGPSTLTYIHETLLLTQIFGSMGMEKEVIGRMTRELQLWNLELLQVCSSSSSVRLAMKSVVFNVDTFAPDIQVESP
jgi:hypothetical protein